MGEALFKDSFHSNSAYEISSAGLGALVGNPADRNVQELLLNDGIDCSQHRAKQVTKEMLSEADLILVMEKIHRHQLIQSMPNICGKVHLLGKWGDFEIPDPYRKSKQVFTETYNSIKKGVKDWQKKITELTCS